MSPLIRFIVFSATLLLNSEKSCCQVGYINSKVYFKYPIFIDVCDQYIYEFSRSDSSVVTNLDSEHSRMIKVIDCSRKGALHFIMKDNIKKLVIVGQYKKADSLSKNEKPSKKYASGKKVISSGPSEFYKPIRIGQWKYYDFSGKICKNEWYGDEPKKEFTH